MVDHRNDTSSEARKIFRHSEKLLKTAYRGDGPLVTAMAMGRAAGVVLGQVAPGKARDFAKKSFAEMFRDGAAEQGAILELRIVERDPPKPENVATETED